MPPFTSKDLIAKVREFAAARPATIYRRADGEQCSNVFGECTDGTFGCIMGQAYRALGLEIEEDYQVSAVATMLKAHKIGFTDGEYRWLNAVQCHQDLGNSWGVAVDVADRACPLLA